MIFFDTETTGLIKNAALKLYHQPHIIEIGAVKKDSAYLIADIHEFHTLINPG